MKTSVLGLLLFSQIVFAAKKNDQFVDSLVQENETLSVSLEDTVQVAKPSSRRTFDFFVGNERLNQYLINLNNEKIQYDMQNLKTINLQYGYYPYRERIMLGLIGGVGYSYLEQHNTFSATSLHLIPIEVMLSSRYAFNSRLEAQASVGGGTMIGIQRGDESYNTSEAKGYGVWQLGASYGPKVQSDMPWEVLLMYGQRFGPSNENKNLSGSFVRLGFGFRLD